MSGGSYDYLFAKETCELFDYSNIRTLEVMESRFLGLGYDDIAKDFRRLIEYIKSANNRVEVLGGQLNEMMYGIEWYDSGDIGADTLAEMVEKYRQADTPQTETHDLRTEMHECVPIDEWQTFDDYSVEMKGEGDLRCFRIIHRVDDTPQTEEQRKVQEAEHRMANIIADIPQTESTGSPIGDYRDGVGAWQTDCSWMRYEE